MNFLFFVNSAALGAGLAMDAFSVSLANGLREPRMGGRRMCGIAGIYAFFQYLMPVAGWLCVRFILDIFSFLEQFIPWAALIMLLYIGGKMLLEGIRERGDTEGNTEKKRVAGSELLIQGVATSIDALSVGFTLASYSFVEANISALIIGAVTFGICLAGLAVGKTAGTRLSWKASVLGGFILIAIGLEIFITGLAGL